MDVLRGGVRHPGGVEVVIESLQSRPPPAPKDPIVPVTESGVFSRAFFEQFKA